MVAQLVKNLHAMQEAQVRSLEDPLEEEMAASLWSPTLLSGSVLTHRQGPGVAWPALGFHCAK